MLHGVLITDDREAAELFGALIRSSEQITLDRTFCPGPSPYQITMALNTLSLDVAFVDVSTPDRAAAISQQLRGKEKPVAIVGFSMRSVARPCPQSITPHTLEFPLSTAALMQTVRRAVTALHPTPYSNVAVFIPAKAGAGASTIAINVAAHLAQPDAHNVLVAECDLRSGILAEYLNLKRNQSMGQTLACADSADALIWPRHVSSRDGIDFLLTDRDPNARRPDWHSYYHLLSFLAMRYRHVLMDLPELVNDATAEVVRSAARVFLVTTPDILSVKLARQRLQELSAVGVGAPRVEILLNREHAGHLRKAEISEFLECEVSTAFPSDERAVNKAILQNSFVEAASSLGRAFASCARSVDGASTAEPWVEHKRSVWDFLGRVSHPQRAGSNRSAVYTNSI